MQYPSVFRRYLSTLLDLLVIWVGVFIVIRIPIISGLDWGIATVVIMLILLYEPILTTYFCTVGQWLFRFRVRAFEGRGRISLSQAYGRLFIKWFLGFISILTIPSHSDRRAIHDFASETIVVEAAAADL